MACLRCWKECKNELCRKCEQDKHRASALISQNKKKLKELLNHNILEPELFSKFMLYTDNIITQWRIYMEYRSKKAYKIFRFITWVSTVASIWITIWSVASLIILKI